MLFLISLFAGEAIAGVKEVKRLTVVVSVNETEFRLNYNGKVGNFPLVPEKAGVVERGGLQASYEIQMGGAVVFADISLDERWKVTVEIGAGKVVGVTLCPINNPGGCIILQKDDNGRYVGCPSYPDTGTSR